MPNFAATSRHKGRAEHAARAVAQLRRRAQISLLALQAAGMAWIAPIAEPALAYGEMIAILVAVFAGAGSYASAATSGMRADFLASAAMTTTTLGVLTTVFPANSHLVRPATAHDAKALRKLAAVSGARPLAGRVLVAEVRGVIAAAISRDEPRTIADPALAPAYLTTILRLRADGLAAVARQPSLAERMREAVAGPREPEQLPLAA